MKPAFDTSLLVGYHGPLGAATLHLLSSALGSVAAECENAEPGSYGSEFTRMLGGVSFMLGHSPDFYLQRARKELEEFAGVAASMASAMGPNDRAYLIAKRDQPVTPETETVKKKPTKKKEAHGKK